MEKTFACNPLVEHPLVLGLLDRILEPNYLLSQLQAINILHDHMRAMLQQLGSRSENSAERSEATEGMAIAYRSSVATGSPAARHSG